ncbi:hypothetical protein [Paraferrimonas sedimenticola]|uniref:hypothetical protein n=1 Tax=Paraferrimonas sedimenticola TaxID=375674 RepID=UPI001140A4BA|nr:hypothetical protein [Paraferrimonas sedimenticola]
MKTTLIVLLSLCILSACQTADVIDTAGHVLTPTEIRHDGAPNEVVRFGVNACGHLKAQCRVEHYQEWPALFRDVGCRCDRSH